MSVFYVCKIVEEDDEDSASYFGPFNENDDAVKFGQEYVRENCMEGDAMSWESVIVTRYAIA